MNLIIIYLFNGQESATVSQRGTLTERITLKEQALRLAIWRNILNVVSQNCYKRIAIRGLRHATTYSVQAICYEPVARRFGSR
jgi:hypothetical protein